mmetsp:Transcript_19277/g.52988  ORF Transcript_19277/g.52988 Transcript_19277/m.52988 type:complete len:83 (-) Transcript_19277:86-334(-)
MLARIHLFPRRETGGKEGTLHFTRMPLAFPEVFIPRPSLSLHVISCAAVGVDIGLSIEALFVLIETDLHPSCTYPFPKFRYE